MYIVSKKKEVNSQYQLFQKHADLISGTYLDNYWLVHFLSVEGGLGTKLWVLVVIDHIALNLLPLTDYLHVWVQS